MFKSSVHKEIELQINDLKLYLENNYKDLAIQALKDSIALVDKYYQEGKLKDKNYVKYKKIIDGYTAEMKDYNHQQFYSS